jgi:hypothetical protein
MDERLPDVPFMFVVGANSAPVVYRAAAYRQVRSGEAVSTTNMATEFYGGVMV